MLPLPVHLPHALARRRSLYHIWLRPLSHMVTGICHIWLQALLDAEERAKVEGKPLPGEE